MVSMGGSVGFCRSPQVSVGDGGDDLTNQNLYQ